VTTEQTFIIVQGYSLPRSSSKHLSGTHLSTWKRVRSRRIECCCAPLGSLMTWDCIVMRPFLSNTLRW